MRGDVIGEGKIRCCERTSRSSKTVVRVFGEFSVKGRNIFTDTYILDGGWQRRLLAGAVC